MAQSRNFQKYMHSNFQFPTHPVPIYLLAYLCNLDRLISLILEVRLLCQNLVLFVSMGVRGKPRMYLLWTFQLWPPDASAPTDASRTLVAEVGTYGREMRTGNLVLNADFHGTF
jgi:hypothetical protein